MKKKILLLQIVIAVIFVCTSVYGVLNTTIDLTQSTTTLKRGEKVTVTLSLKGVDANKKITSVSGYINYNKNVLDNITVDNIQKDSNGKVKIGNEELAVEDLTNASIDNMPSTVAYVGFNGNPTSDNDVRLVIDFNNGITYDVDLLKIDFNVKSNATLGEIKNAISYSMFVISSETEQTEEITKNIDITVQASENDNNNNTNNNNINNNNVNNNIKNNINNNINNNKNNNINNNINNNSNNIVNNNTNNNNRNNSINNNTYNNSNRNNNTTNNNVINNTNTNNLNKGTNSNKTDNTTAAGTKLPKTGARLFIFPIIILAILSYVSYIKYKQYKSI